MNVSTGSLSTNSEMILAETESEAAAASSYKNERVKKITASLGMKVSLRLRQIQMPCSKRTNSILSTYRAKTNVGLHPSRYPWGALGVRGGRFQATKRDYSEGTINVFVASRPRMASVPKHNSSPITHFANPRFWCQRRPRGTLLGFGTQSCR
jgi:hypothetical protein